LVVADVFKLLRHLADNGTTILMVEQNVKTALKFSDDVVALEAGRVVLHKPANVLLNEPNLERLFLGGVVAKV
jgi:branched-chain amino acid transport system ATP-binding protein